MGRAARARSRASAMAEAAAQASTSTITVKGSGSVLVPYDRASVRVSVVCHHASSVVSARDACASATAKYIEGLTDAGGLAVPAGQITTSSISISQEVSTQCGRRAGRSGGLTKK